MRSWLFAMLMRDCYRRADNALDKKASRNQYEELLKEGRKLEIELPQIEALKQVS